ncbi:hypothetical protein J22TS3_39250 [Paenibacillus sp. J22TS3]|nr:hypothetical protein J22TS3_39250 [Paenibacillus sp. J22TS3]
MKKIILSLILAVGVFSGVAATEQVSQGGIQALHNHGVGG